MKTSMKYIQAFMFMLAISMVPRTMAATDVLESPEDVMPESIMPIEVEPEAPAESGCGLMGALRSLFRPMFAVDIHDTQVDIGSPVPDDPNSFLVTVSRVDQLFDGYNGGEFMGKRLQSVRLSFDVIDNVLHCNGQPVIEGISNMKVEAETVTVIAADNMESAESILPLFDTGLVAVQFQMAIEEMVQDNLVIRRMVVTEKILEIDGELVEQHEEMQIVIDVFPDGSVVQQQQPQAMPISAPKESLVSHGYGDSQPVRHLCSHVAAWFRDLPAYARGLLIVGYAIVMILASFVISLAISNYVDRRRQKYVRLVGTEGELESVVSSKVSIEKPLLADA